MSVRSITYVARSNVEHVVSRLNAYVRKCACVRLLSVRRTSMHIHALECRMCVHACLYAQSHVCGGGETVATQNDQEAKPPGNPPRKEKLDRVIVPFPCPRPHALHTLWVRAMVQQSNVAIAKTTPVN